jgi:hypothetical protein
MRSVKCTKRPVLVGTAEGNGSPSLRYADESDRSYPLNGIWNEKGASLKTGRINLKIDQTPIGLRHNLRRYCGSNWLPALFQAGDF